MPAVLSVSAVPNLPTVLSVAGVPGMSAVPCFLVQSVPAVPAVHRVSFVLSF